jgi:hypothetical protein
MHMPPQILIEQPAVRAAKSVKRLPFQTVGVALPDTSRVCG